MFSNVGWAEILVLAVVALVVLGPERLPEAARWLASMIRKVRDFASDAQRQLKDDYGADLAEFREPLQQLNDLRGLSPRAIVTKHLLDGDDSLFTGDFGAAAPAGGAALPGSSPQGRQPGGSGGGSAEPRQAPSGSGPAGNPSPPPGQSSTPPSAGPVWDTDAT